MGALFRNPRSQQERRANSSPELRRVEIMIGGEILEVRIPIRGRRSAAMLVNAWHDISREMQRSWKEHRRTQYKGMGNRPLSPMPHSVLTGSWTLASVCSAVIRAS
jgi:hypothetical protein